MSFEARYQPPMDDAASAVTLTAEQLFARYFLPLYAPELRADLAKVRTTDVNPAGNPRVTAQLDTIAETFAQLAPAALGLEATEDLQLDFSDASIHRLSAALTRARRDALCTAVDAVGEIPPIVQLVTHGAIYVAACVVRNHGGEWRVRNPLWESLVRLESRSGIGDLAVFQWWLKALSDDEIDEARLADRYRTHVEVPCAKPEQLPRIADPERKLPRLSKVRYDSLHKYLRAHLPELRSVGRDFPSAERLDELGFQWLEFVLVGDGRMLLMHGPAERGVYLFWLDLSGFSASAFYPADAFPAHVLKIEGDKIVVHLPILGVDQFHEMLWWGPSDATLTPDA